MVENESGLNKIFSRVYPAHRTRSTRFTRSGAGSGTGPINRIKLA